MPDIETNNRGQHDGSGSQATGSTAHLLVADVAASNKTDGTNLHTLPWSEIERVASPLLKEVDTDNKGAVTRSEVSAAVVDPKYTGEQSQVLAGLYNQFDRTAKLSGGDGKTLTENTPKALYGTFYGSEYRASHLIALDDWTKSHIAGIDKGKKGYVDQSDLTSALATYTGVDKKMVQELNTALDIVGIDGRLTAKNLSAYVDGYLLNDPLLTFTDTFEQTMKRTSVAESNTVSHDLYGDAAHPEKSIQAKAVDQGFTNDCSFNAPLAALANERPSDIKNMISPKGPDSFEVRFPGADHAVTVSAPTTTEQGILDEASPSGFWPTVLEKAYGQLKIDADPAAKSAHLISEDVLNHRAPLKDAIEMLTGHQVEDKLLSDTSKDDVVKILQQSLTNGANKVVSLGTGSLRENGSTKDGFILNHGFSVLAFVPGQSGDGQVVVRDTYGQGGKDGDGVSTISVQTVMDNFTDIVYEK